MIVKWDEKTQTAEIELDGDDVLMWAKGSKIYIHALCCRERPVIIDESLYTEEE